jgi:hypothetical protein
MNRAIGSMTLFRDATDCMENILNVVKPDASVYTARYVDPEQAVTIRRIKVAKDCIRELIYVCTREGPKILAKMNKSGTAVGWYGGSLGVMPCRSLLSPRGYSLFGASQAPTKTVGRRGSQEKVYEHET